MAEHFYDPVRSEQRHFARSACSDFDAGDTVEYHMAMLSVVAEDLSWSDSQIIEHVLTLEAGVKAYCPRHLPELQDFLSN